MSDAHRTVGKRFAEAGVAEDRFVDVHDGAKMCTDHDTRWSDPENVPGTNYGIYVDADDQFLILDIDVHRNDAAAETIVPVAALEPLDETLEVKSPHVEEDSPGGHDLLKLDSDRTPAELFKDEFGVKNPVPSWGEVIAKNKYAVGPGSQLNGCDKDWCDDCETPTGGRYTVETDAPIATVGEEELVAALAADPDLERDDGSGENETLDDSVMEAAAISDTEVVAGDVTGAESSPADDSEYPDLTRDQVEALLDEIPGDQHFDEWIATGYAVLAWDAGATGKEVFENWSRTNKKWERQESQRQIDYIWSQGDPNGDSRGNAGVGKLVALAREYGDPDVFGGQPSEPTPAELIAEHNDEYDTAADVPDDLKAKFGPAADQHDEETTTTSWRRVRELYDAAANDRDTPKGPARQAAQEVLEGKDDWMYVLESEQLWVYDDASGTFGRFGEEKIDQTLVEELGQHYARTERNEIVARIAANNGVHREALNARSYDSPLLCVGNGVIDLETGEIQDHDPEYRFVRGLKWDYNPDDAATDRDAILEFIDDVTERQADRDTLLDHLAHGLMPGHPYRAFVVTYGPGGNGKTQLAHLFREFVGDENAASVEIDELVNDDFATSDLVGKFINWGDDMSGDGGGSLDELSQLKKASGGSMIRANEKYEKTFDFQNQAALFFSANEPPRMGETKASVKDRLYPIHMPYRFKEDPDPDDAFEKQKIAKAAESLTEDPAAMRGLLALVVEHAEELRDRRGEYSMPESPQERWERYHEQADPIVRFARTALEPAGPDAKVRKDDVYRVYTSFAEEWSERTAGERGFKRQLPRSLEADVETAQSRPLATPDDDADRVRCWKRLSWTEDAREYMPGWMVERYSHQFDDDQDTDDDGGDDGDGDDNRHDIDTTPVAAVADDPSGFPDVRGEIAVVDEPDNDSAPALKATLIDEDGDAIELVVWDDPDVLPADPGDEVVLRNVALDEFDGKVQLVVRPGVTDVTVLRHPVEPENDDQTDLDDATASTETHEETDHDHKTEDAASDEAEPPARDTTTEEGGRATADGGEDTAETGPPDDATGARADAQRLAAAFKEHEITDADSALDAASAAAFVVERTALDLPPDDVHRALEKGAREITPALFMEVEEGFYAI